MCFFFFKHKTAYVMRINDWSSDVCSSDLETAAEVDERRGNTPLLSQFCGKRHRLRLRLDKCRRIEILRAGKDMKATKITARIPDAVQQRRHQRHIHTEGLSATAHLHADRKSVVEGKSVPVRVDRGGRRNIKKQKKTRNQTRKCISHNQQ